MMFVSIVLSKICYGSTRQEYDQYVAAKIVQNLLQAAPAQLIQQPAQMDDGQFIRFKNAGKQHDSKRPGKMNGQRTRTNRTQDPALQKWDVGEYGSLTGRAGPWGNGAATNRDHMTANSSNQLMFNAGNWPGAANSASAVKREALAITVSGHHHRKGSYTFGGRTKIKDTAIAGMTRMEYGAANPTKSFRIETAEMLQWKAAHTNSAGMGKNTLRLEMVGAYAYMYKMAVRNQLIDPTFKHDLMLMRYLKIAVSNDDRKHRF